MTKSDHNILKGLVRDLNAKGTLPTFQMQKLYRLAGSIGRRTGRTVTQVVDSYVSCYC